MPYPFHQFRLLLIGTLPIAVAIYSIWYWVSDHQQLVNWYTSINPFFYKAETWGGVFFTETVKHQGNWWCAATLFAAIIGAYFSWKTPFPAFPKIVLKKQQVFFYIGVTALGVALSLNANFHTTYSPDEVFSSLNFGALPLFQTLSYYALPNNHPLFNSISGALYFLSDDYVMMGRMVSLFCYVGVLLFTWYFLGKWQMSNWLRAIALIVLAIQFPVWGFSGQARGYEMVLLFSCFSFGAFYNYYITGKNYWLPLHTACNIAGMLTIPTYLYWWLGMLLASSIFQLIDRGLDREYVRSSIVGFTICLILYLPLLTFSGVQSITHNKYVQAANSTHWYFLTNLNEHKFFDVLFKEWFCTEQAVVLIGVACSMLPILLLIHQNKNTPQRVFGITYFSILFSFLAMAVLMLKFPFTRNMIAHGYLVLLAIIITLLKVFQSKIIRLLIGVLLLLYARYSFNENYKKIPYHLYYFDVGGYVKNISKFDLDIKSGSTVYLDDECFYWWHVLREKYPNNELVIEYNKAKFNMQDFCVMPIDSFPPVDSVFYQLLESGPDQQVFGKHEIK